MEASLHEIDRARTAYVYGAQLADPRRNPEYWGEWHEFEVSHGNEETFCEMLRVKRGVQAAFSTVNYNAVEMGGSGSGGDGMRLKNGDADTPLTDEQAIAMMAAQEDVEGDMDMSMVIGGGNGNNVKSKRPRTMEVKDLDEVEQRAAKLRKVTAGLVASTQEAQQQAHDDEGIDIDDNDEGG